jgi:hypothetical protein
MFVVTASDTQMSLCNISYTHCTHWYITLLGVLLAHCTCCKHCADTGFGYPGRFSLSLSFTMSFTHKHRTHTNTHTCFIHVFTMFYVLSTVSLSKACTHITDTYCTADTHTLHTRKYWEYSISYILWWQVRWAVRMLVSADTHTLKHEKSALSQLILCFGDTLRYVNVRTAKTCYFGSWSGWAQSAKHWPRPTWYSGRASYGQKTRYMHICETSVYECKPTQSIRNRMWILMYWVSLQSKDFPDSVILANLGLPLIHTDPFRSVSCSQDSQAADMCFRAVIRHVCTKPNSLRRFRNLGFPAYKTGQLVLQALFSAKSDQIWPNLTKTDDFWLWHDLLFLWNLTLTHCTQTHRADSDTLTRIMLLLHNTVHSLIQAVTHTVTHTT